MNHLSELISRLEAAGGELGLNGDRVIVKYSNHCKEVLSPLLQLLRENRAGLVDLLRARGGSEDHENQCMPCRDAGQGLAKGESVAPKIAAAPPMPPHIRLVQWNPKKTPIAIDSCTVVVDVALFIKKTLEQLNTALTDDQHWVGWSVPQLTDRLRQAGVVVELDK